MSETGFLRSEGSSRFLDFNSKTPEQIANEIVAMIDANGGLNDVTQAFEAVYNIKDQTQRHKVYKRVEESLIARAKHDAAAWIKVTAALDANPGDEDLTGEMLALRDNLQRLRPMAQAFLKIFTFLGGALSDTWTRVIYDNYKDFSDSDRKSTDKLAELFAAAYNTIENHGDAAPVKPVVLPQWTDIVGILNKDGATSAIAKLESYDQPMRARFTDALEKDFIYISGEMFRNARVSVADYKADNEKKLTENLAFGTYLAKAKGAAANTQLGLYLEALAAVVNERPENYTSLASVLQAVVAHRAAADNQDQLKAIFRKRKTLTHPSTLK